MRLNISLQRGYSLVELMVTVAVISVLAGIAIPLYDGYVLEGKLVSIRTTLNGMRTPIEEYRLENGNYGPTATLAGINAIKGQFDWTPSGDTGNFSYTVDIISTNSYDVWGQFGSDGWARCDDRYSSCCDSETTGSAAIVACP